MLDMWLLIHASGRVLYLHALDVQYEIVIIGVSVCFTRIAHICFLMFDAVLGQILNPMNVTLVTTINIVNI